MALIKRKIIDDLIYNLFFYICDRIILIGVDEYAKEFYKEYF